MRGREGREKPLVRKKYEEKVRMIMPKYRNAAGV